VVPNLASRLWKDGLDRQQEAHLMWFEDAALRIDKRDPASVGHADNTEDLQANYRRPGYHFPAVAGG
jgi:hypothetical protein